MKMRELAILAALLVIPLVIIFKVQPKQIIHTKTMVIVDSSEIKIGSTLEVLYVRADTVFIKTANHGKETPSP